MAIISWLLEWNVEKIPIMQDLKVVHLGMYFFNFFFAVHQLSKVVLFLEHRHTFISISRSSCCSTVFTSTWAQSGIQEWRRSAYIQPLLVVLKTFPDRMRMTGRRSHREGAEDARVALSSCFHIHVDCQRFFS